MYSWLPNASAPVSGRLPLSMVVAAQFGRLRPLRCLPISKRHTVPHIYICEYDVRFNQCWYAVHDTLHHVHDAWGTCVWECG